MCHTGNQNGWVMVCWTGEGGYKAHIAPISRSSRCMGVGWGGGGGALRQSVRQRD